MWEPWTPQDMEETERDWETGITVDISIFGRNEATMSSPECARDIQTPLFFDSGIKYGLQWNVLKWNSKSINKQL